MLEKHLKQTTFLKSSKKIIDIIVLELDLYESEGLTVLRRIKEEYPGTRVLIYSNQPEEVYAISSLKAGASGYLNKKANQVLFAMPY